MTRAQKFLVGAVIWPIVALLGLTAHKAYLYSQGREVILPIEGYDPRDLLSGHYLVYRIIYGVESICHDAADAQPGYICLQPKAFSYDKPGDCALLIQGHCQGGAFLAGIERFYIPESEALQLDAQVRGQKASIVLSVSRGGKAQVKNLLVNGRAWNTKKSNSP